MSHNNQIELIYKYHMMLAHCCEVAGQPIRRKWYSIVHLIRFLVQFRMYLFVMKCTPPLLQQTPKSLV